MPIDYQSLQACYLRATRLTAAGLPVTASDSVATIASFISVENGLVVADGDSLEKKSACGAIVATYEDCDKVKGTEGGMVLTNLDAEFISLTTGAPTLLDDLDAVIGFALPSFNAGCPNGFALEVWTRAWDGNQPAVDGSDVLWYRHFWPRQTARLDTYTIDGEFLEVPLVMKGSGNSSLTAINGPTGDWPDMPGDAASSAYGVFLTKIVPTVAPGLTAYPIT